MGISGINNLNLSILQTADKNRAVSRNRLMSERQNESDNSGDPVIDMTRQLRNVSAFEAVVTDFESARNLSGQTFADILYHKNSEKIHKVLPETRLLVSSLAM